MAHWLEVPDLEELLKAKDEMPPSLDLLRECVETIAAALERDVVHEGEPPIVTFRNHHGAYYNVSVHAEEYRITYIHLARIEFAQRHTEELAWKICGYRCTPARCAPQGRVPNATGLSETFCRTSISCDSIIIAADIARLFREGLERQMNGVA